MEYAGPLIPVGPIFFVSVVDFEKIRIQRGSFSSSLFSHFGPGHRNGVFLRFSLAIFALCHGLLRRRCCLRSERADREAQKTGMDGDAILFRMDGSGRMDNPIYIGGECHSLGQPPQEGVSNSMAESHFERAVLPDEPRLPISKPMAWSAV